MTIGVLYYERPTEQGKPVIKMHILRPHHPAPDQYDAQTIRKLRRMMSLIQAIGEILELCQYYRQRSGFELLEKLLDLSLDLLGEFFGLRHHFLGVLENLSRDHVEVIFNGFLQ